MKLYKNHYFFTQKKIEREKFPSVSSSTDNHITEFCWILNLPVFTVIKMELCWPKGYFFF